MHWIKGYLLLTSDYRGLPRPSSAVEPSRPPCSFVSTESTPHGIAKLHVFILWGICAIGSGTLKSSVALAHLHARSVISRLLRGAPTPSEFLLPGPLWGMIASFSVTLPA